MDNPKFKVGKRLYYYYVDYDDANQRAVFNLSDHRIEQVSHDAAHCYVGEDRAHVHATDIGRIYFFSPYEAVQHAKTFLAKTRDDAIAALSSVQAFEIDLPPSCLGVEIDDDFEGEVNRAIGTSRWDTVSRDSLVKAVVEAFMKRYE